MKVMIFSDEKNDKPENMAQTGESAPVTSELETCREALAQSSQKYIYLVAEFDNFKRRTEREKAQWITQAQAQLLVDVLPIVDDFERALSDIEEKQFPPELAAYVSGFELIARALQKFLKTHNVQEITDLTHFDPEKHEAIMQVTSDQHKSGDIVTVLQKGYIFKNQVIRPARVSVAQ